MASTAASALAFYVWGRLSGQSSGQTLIAAEALGALVFAAVWVSGVAFGGLGGGFGAVAAIFASRVAYEGVRAGRKLHLTDMAEDGFRARCTALSTTLIGIALLAGGLFGVAADRFGPAPVLLTFSLVATVGAFLARGLEEVSAANDAGGDMAADGPVTRIGKHQPQKQSELCDLALQCDRCRFKSPGQAPSLRCPHGCSQPARPPARQAGIRAGTGPARPRQSGEAAGSAHDH